jgi:p-aminobenzoyl-glutamate transporter AbgT
MANMVPYSLLFTVFGILLVIGWAAAGLPPGPGASLHYTLPTAG